MSRDFQGPAVLHLISSLEVGGAERLLIDFVRSCAEITADPLVPQVVVVMNDRLDENMVSELNSTSVPVYYLGRPESSKNPRYLFDLLKIIRKHHISIIHSHTPGAKYWSMLCRVAHPRLKLTHTFHQTFIGMGSTGVSAHNSMIDSTIVISEAVAKEVRTRKIRRVAVIENGIPISNFRSVSPEPLGSMAKLITVGRLCPSEKGQDVLIRAVKRCVDRGIDVECTFVGSPAIGDFDTLPALEALTATLQLEDRIQFTQGRTDVATLLAGANIFVLPSRREGFGLALVEAMAAGLPVIVSNIEGPADIVTDGIDGILFECGSDVQLAEKIVALLQSPSLAEELGKNGRLKSSIYEISVMRDKYIDVYRRLAG
jgi:glycosyltransferase involved in cell wall biosynthesis